MENIYQTALPITPKVGTRGPDHKELVEVSEDPKEIASTSDLEERSANWGSD